MTRTLHFAIPGDIATPTGGYAYDRRLIDELRGAGWQVEHLALPGSFPHPDTAALAETRARFAALPRGTTVLVDGLALGVMPGMARGFAASLDLVALVHHPLADESGLTPDTAAALERSEREALAAARAVVCTSQTTARRLVDGFGVEPPRIVVAPPGTDQRPRSTGSGCSAPLVLSIGTLVPRKGHDVLLAALARVRHVPWTARIVGADDRDAECAAALRAQACDLGLGEQVFFVGAVAGPDAELLRADVFALATRNEGYGMAFAEALACGLPVVGCRVGAVPEVVPGGAGALVPPDDSRAFAAALEPLLVDADFRRSRADAAWAAGQALPSWHDTASIVARCLGKR